jgi:hypothetical protein
MELYLQLGSKMMKLASSLISEWDGGTVILSPRDLESKQLRPFSNKINRLPNGAVMLDPQFYLPDADHKRLVSHDYWVDGYSTGTFFAGPQLNRLLYNLKLLNEELKTSAVILPGILGNEITDDWLNAQLMILEEAKTTNFGRPLCQTIAITSDVCRDDTQVAKLLEHIAKYPAEIYYLVCEHPKGNYLVDDATWLANVLDISAGLKLTGAKVIIGYCSHQMIVASIVKADAIASGTWLNVRAFPPAKFRIASEEETLRRAIWYYCPQALSEYKVPFLDIARKLGILSSLAPIDADPEIKALFSGGQPTTIGLAEQTAFMHYLKMLRNQVKVSVKDTFDETVSNHDTTLLEAETLLRILKSNKISGQRDFSEAIDANRAAVEVIKFTRGPMLRRNWSVL